MVASDSFPALGTTATLFVNDPAALERGRSVLSEEIDAIDRACSRFRSDSELSRLNAAQGEPMPASALFLEAVEVALRAARLTNGLVDPTVGQALRAIGYDRDFDALPAARSRSPMRGLVPGWRAVSVDRSSATVRTVPGIELDLGATAKALCADRAARRLGAELGVGTLVNLGGDISTAGQPPEGGWRVQIAEDHRRHEQAAEAVTISSGGLATSSTGVRRWVLNGQDAHHIVDPRSGSSAPATWRTVTVAAATCVDANIASTAAIVVGSQAPGWLARCGLPSRLVARDGAVSRIAGWPEARS